MARIIDYDVEARLGRLSILDAAQFTYAGGQAVKRFGYAAKQHHSLQMAGRFENPVPFTINSPRYEANGLEVRLYLNPDGPKGNAPATYIYPADRGSDSNTAYPTRFARGLSRLGVTNLFPVPYTYGRAVRRNTYGNMTPGQYQETLAGLARNDGTYFSVPDNRSSRPLRGNLPRGIYQRKGRTVSMLFGYRDSAPSIRQPYAFEDITRRLAQQQLPKLLREELSKARR